MYMLAMKKSLFLILAICIIIGIGIFVRNNTQVGKQEIKMDQAQSSNTDSTEKRSFVTPISHASMVLNMGQQVIYADPVGADLFKNQPKPNIIVITDIHGDHMDAATLKAVSQTDTIIVVPQAVKDQLTDPIPGKMVVVKNGEKTNQNGVEIEAIPMYNIPESSETFHIKGRGNGYILSSEGMRVYIAGDTSATPEMKALKDIDVAFVPMNLPYTMDEEEAAEGVLAFKPKVVHPYHYRGQSGLADINKFKELVNAKDPNIDVQLLNFYPENK